MDRRFNDRISADLPVRINQLDDGMESVGYLRDLSDSGVCSLFAVPLVPGALVKLEILGLTLYGQVVYSDLEDDLFRTGIFVEPALLDSSNITELVRDFITTAAGRT